MVMKLTMAPNKILSTPSEEILKDTIESLSKLIDDMLVTMKDRGGIGLAAPQIGINKRLTVIQHESFGPDPMVLINPMITEVSEGMVASEEGCLSVPELQVTLSRHEKVQVTYLDRNGDEQILNADGLLARCLQHEIDHLNGTLIIDVFSKLKKDMIIRRLKKFKKKYGIDK